MKPKIGRASLRVLTALEQHWKDRRVSPTFRELMERTEIRSTNTISYHIHLLQRAGLVEHTPFGACRSLVLVKKHKKGVR